MLIGCVPFSRCWCLLAIFIHLYAYGCAEPVASPLPQSWFGNAWQRVWGDTTTTSTATTTTKNPRESDPV